MTPDNESLSELLMKVQEEHVSKRGLSQCHSELAYIEEAARLEGYGQESFPAKVSKTKQQCSLSLYKLVYILVNS